MSAVEQQPRLGGMKAGDSIVRPAAATLPRRRRSSLTRRILTLNVLALAIPVAGLLYLGEYRSSLVQQQLDLLRTEGELFSGALAASGVVTDPSGGEELLPETTRSTVRRLVDISKNRARLFDQTGALIADSARLVSPAGQFEIEILPPPESDTLITRLSRRLYDWVTGWLPQRKPLPLYRERAEQVAGDYPEVLQALAGEPANALRVDRNGGLVLSVAVPVQRYRQVLGAVMLTSNGDAIDAAIRDVRFSILKVFGAALAVTILLSLYLAGTIARPVHRLAEAAERVRRGKSRQLEIPDFTRRGDEIGDLSGALREMTEALWTRMDAIEHFAADVAHEIKNPLSSLRSAVETVARMEDPARQRKLMAIILDDVQRLDRLISDISDASRVDAELSRADKAPQDIGQLLQTLAEVHEATAKPGAPRIVVGLPKGQSLMAPVIEGRLVQVLRNLIANAISFSPPGGIITLGTRRDGRRLLIYVSDQGPGIPADKLEAIFDRFYSERPSGEKFGTHSGLGLSISRQIIEAHGGRIFAENLTDLSGTSTGARFTIILPCDMNMGEPERLPLPGEASRLQVHGTAVAIEGQGVLLRGPAGAGKSDLAWRLIEAGAVLIADDLCEIRRQSDHLVIDLPAAVDPRFRGCIERRGLGIMTVPWFGPAALALVADLAAGASAARAPETVELLGLVLPLAVLDPFSPSAIPFLHRMALPQLVD